MSDRNLTDQEISILEKQGCVAETWASVFVKDGFSTERIHRVRFSGQVKLGVFNKQISVGDGLVRPSGLYDSDIQDCVIGDNVRVANTGNLINYDIENEVVIEHVGSLQVTGETSFGNGTKIKVLNEGGGREVVIFDRLSSQIAYLLTVYRHDKKLIKKLTDLIEIYILEKKATRGVIQKSARVSHCQQIKNVLIGRKAVVSGAMLLKEGTISSSEQDPVFVGEGVVAKSFIIQSGSKVDGGAVLDHCFVGQGVRIGKLFSASESCFFANSEGYHSEASHIFAGPFTVTHHKSTLLIAGLFSFFNAGSGTNQSNHMYKLGPIHQGILERGVKTGSFSYMLWPCRVGAFTTVIGKHYSNFDTGDLPFSYILNTDNQSVLVPAVNLTNIGTRRDNSKWPIRDRRRDPEKFDLIHFQMFSPYTLGKMMRGAELLKKLDIETPGDVSLVKYNGIMIKRAKLKNGSATYLSAVDTALCGEVVKRLESSSDELSLESFRTKTSASKKNDFGDWLDLAGLFVPQKQFDNLIHSLHTGTIQTLDQLHQHFKKLHQSYDLFSWNWCQIQIQQRFGFDFKNITVEQLIHLVQTWEKGAVRFNRMILKDATKEFSESSRIGYGLDGDSNVRDQDFEAVRNTFEVSGFLTLLKKEISTIQERSEILISVLSRIK